MSSLPHLLIPVIHTLIAKEMTSKADGSDAVVHATLIQRHIAAPTTTDYRFQPYQQRHGQPLSLTLQKEQAERITQWVLPPEAFSYRVNYAPLLDIQKRNDCIFHLPSVNFSEQDNPSSGSGMTYSFSSSLPMTVQTIWSAFPFSIKQYSVSLELSPYKHPSEAVMFRPSLILLKGSQTDKYSQTLCRVYSFNDENAWKVKGAKLLSSTPEIYLEQNNEEEERKEWDLEFVDESIKKRHKHSKNNNNIKSSECVYYPRFTFIWYATTDVADAVLGALFPLVVLNICINSIYYQWRLSDADFLSNILGIVTAAFVLLPVIYKAGLDRPSVKNKEYKTLVAKAVGNRGRLIPGGVNFDVSRFMICCICIALILMVLPSYDARVAGLIVHWLALLMPLLVSLPLYLAVRYKIRNHLKRRAVLPNNQIPTPRPSTTYTKREHTSSETKINLANIGNAYGSMMDDEQKCYQIQLNSDGAGESESLKATLLPDAN